MAPGSDSPPAPPPLPPTEPSPLPPPRRHFTRGCLIPVLVTAGIVFVGILGISFLAGLAVPMFGAVRKKMKTEQTRTLSMQLVHAVKNFYTEYSRYPLPVGSVDAESSPLRTDARFTAILLGADTTLNPKRIRFLADLNAVAKSGDFGLKSTATGVSVVDPWGEELYVLVDADYSGDLANPDPAAAAKMLYQGVLVYSAGPDKDPSTWKDNVITWGR